MKDGSEHVRAWAYRFCEDRHLASLHHAVTTEKSLFARLHLVSCLQRVSLADRGALAGSLIRSGVGVGDKNLEVMMWYAIEPLAARDLQWFGQQLFACKSPRLREFMARRIASEIGTAEGRGTIAGVLKKLRSSSGEIAEPVFNGLAKALKKQQRTAMPDGWRELAQSPVATASPAIAEAVLQIATTFGDEQVIGDLELLVGRQSESGDRRNAALSLLIKTGVPDLKKLLLTSLEDPVLRRTGIRGLVGFSDDSIPILLIGRFKSFDRDSKSATVDLLTSRKTFARELLDALAEKRIPRSAISPSQAMQIAGIRDRELSAKLTEHWGKIRATDDEKKRKIEKLQTVLAATPESNPDLKRGREIFARSCASCHQLFGNGGKLGPDLTGTGRKNAGYLLPNIIDPGALVPRDYRMTSVTARDGTVYAGVVPEQTRDYVVVQTLTDEHQLDRKNVLTIRALPDSFMPEGLLDGLSDAEIRDLFAYLAK